MKLLTQEVGDGLYSDRKQEANGAGSRTLAQLGLVIGQAVIRMMPEVAKVGILETPLRLYCITVVNIIC